MVDNIAVHVSSLRIVQDRRVPKILKAGQEEVQVEWSLSIDVVETHDELEGEHQGHEHPPESNEKRILAQSPQHLHNYRIAVIQTIGVAHITSYIANIDRYRGRYRCQLTGSRSIRPHQCRILKG